MSVINALFLRFGRVVPASQITPQLADELHSALAKVMMYAKSNNIKLTKQQIDYIMKQTRELDLYEGKGIKETVKGPKADVIDLSKKLGPDAPYSAQNPQGWMPKEGEYIPRQGEGIMSQKGFNQNLVDDTIDLFKSKTDNRSFQDELKKLMLRKGTYADYSADEIEAILKGIKTEPDPSGLKEGGRIGYKFGTGKKGVELLMESIKNKFGKKSITTADKVARPESAVTRDMFKDFSERLKQKDIKNQSKETYERLRKEDPEKFAPNKDRLLTDDEIRDYEEVLGDSETWMNKGTVEEAEAAVKRQKEYEQQMYAEYKVDKQARKELEEAYKEIDFRMTGEDTKYEANELADMLSEIRYKTEYSDLPQKTQLDLYDEAYNYLMEVKRDAANFKGATNIKTGKNIVTGEQEIPIDPMTGKPRKLNAKGGRIGFSVGGIDKVRRALLKMFGGAAATGIAVKTGLGGLLKGGEKAKDVVKTAETVKTAANTPPNYVFDLIKIIKAKGKDITKQAGTIERETVTSYRGVELYETPNGVVIRAEGKTPYEGGKEIQLSLNKTTDVVDEGKKTQKQVSKVEYEEATVRPDPEGKMKDVDFYVDETDHAELKRIVDEEKGFKSGGLAYMLGE